VRLSSRPSWGAVSGSCRSQIEHALAAGDLSRHHDDPFDRMLVAQAIAEGLTIITRDVRLRAYGVATIEA
jgi:PIN domain nuclease of toxin-antitoxin system